MSESSDNQSTSSDWEDDGLLIAPSADKNVPPPSKGRQHLFATLVAANVAAVQLLDSVRKTATPDSYLSSHLVVHGARIGYQLFLDPNTLSGSWLIGAGRRIAGCSRLPGFTREVDFLLCPPDKSPTARRARESIATHHGIFYLHRESRVLLFRGLSSIHKTHYQHGRLGGTSIQANRHAMFGHGQRRTLDGTTADDAPATQPATQPVCVMYKRENLLRLGEYHFKLVYARPSQQLLFDIDMAREPTMQKGPAWPLLDLSMFPDAHHKLVRSVVVHRALGQSLHRTVSAGVNVDTGRSLMLVTLAWKPHLDRNVQRQLKYMSAFEDNLSHGVVGIIDSWCRHGSPPCVLASTRRTRLCSDQVFYTAAYISTFWDGMEWDDVEVHDRIKYFRQTLTGLHTIHEKGLTHGRIRPLSLVILPRGQPEDKGEDGDCKMMRDWIGRSFRTIAALDFPRKLRATQRSDRPKVKGPWVAPEVWESSAENPYDHKADIFALAACCIYMFSASEIEHLAEMDHGDHYAGLRDILSALKPRLPADLFSLLSDMTARDPADRPTAAAAMAHCAWEYLNAGRARFAVLDRLVRQNERTERLERSGSAKRMRLA